MTNSEMLRRIERLERLALIQIEIEDLREVEITIYEAQALDEIYRSEGREGLADLAGDPATSETVRALINEYLHNINKKE